MIIMIVTFTQSAVTEYCEIASQYTLGHIRTCTPEYVVRKERCYPRLPCWSAKEGERFLASTCRYVIREDPHAIMIATSLTGINISIKTHSQNYKSLGEVSL